MHVEILLASAKVIKFLKIYRSQELINNLRRSLIKILSIKVFIFEYIFRAWQIVMVVGLQFLDVYVCK